VTKNKHDYSRLIIFAALVVTVTRYIGAFVASDVGEITGTWSVILTVLMAISGIGMGVLDVLGLAYVFDGWRRNLPGAGKKWSSRFDVLTAFVVGLFVVGLAILTPFTMSRVNSASMSETLGNGVWWWSLAVNLAPILIIGGVTFSQAGFVMIREDAQTSAHDAPHVPASPAHVCKQCGVSCDSQQQLAAHTRWKHANGKAHPVITVE
jgi:MFS family permease